MKVAILAERRVSLDEAHVLEQALKKFDHQVYVVDVASQFIQKLVANRPDVCCIAAGTTGGKGSLQEVLELLQIPFIGSCAQACHLAEDPLTSFFALCRFAEASDEEVSVVPLAAYEVSKTLLGILESLSTDQRAAELEALALRCEERLPGGYPFEVVVNSGAAFGEVPASGKRDSVCSAGLGPVGRKVKTREELVAMFLAVSDTGCIVRQWIEGIRASVAVLGTGWDAHVLPPVEHDESASLYAPIRLSSLAVDKSTAQAIRSELERCAFEVCLALGLRDFAVVELIWDGAQVRFVGVEAQPSLVDGSVFSRACDAAELSVEGVLDHIISL